MNGNISSMNGKPYIHCHACLSDGKMNAFAGHLKEAKVSAACEVFLVSANIKVKRRHDDTIGLNLLDL
jgi:uncharacterized protein